jgi:tetratricopeptide (TPR) repeat protein
VRKTVACLGIGLSALALLALYLWTNSDDSNLPGGDIRERPNVPAAQEESTNVHPLLTQNLHPLLDQADELVLAEGCDEVQTTAGVELATLIRTLVGSSRGDHRLVPLTIDYPLDESIFPPEIVPPTFLWHEEVEQVDTWLFDVALGGDSDHIYVVSPGNPPPSGEIDPRCIAKTNEVYKPTSYQASAKSWTPGGQVWAAVKKRSVEQAASVTVIGFNSARPARAISRGRMTMTTSKDPVGAPVFYRDVPLAPNETKKGVIRPLGESVVPLIAWRLRDISKPRSRLLITEIPTCTNCHSFSADGKTLGMDLDGPKGDKGAYVIVGVQEQTVIRPRDVISWNSFKGKPEGHKTIGFLSRISPDGQYAVTTLNEEKYTCNFPDYKFLQVFFPTRGILAYYRRATDQIEALPGADDPHYVHCDAVWSPDGEYLVFARAEAKDAYPENYQPPQYPNDPAETQIQYDLYRIPFSDGRGGTPQPIAGASHNGTSNTFPKVSPDGKWIVFVKCRNGQLMRPDGTLWIVPAAGGQARRMRANTWRMNSWHSFSPNSRWLVFSSKANTPYTQMYLTHLDENGNDSPAILIPDSTAANRAVNLPEFVNISYEGLASISVPALDYLRHGMRAYKLLEEEKVDEALAELETAIELQPDYMEARAHLAVILAGKGMIEEAKTRLEKILEEDPDCWLAQVNLGVILAGRGRQEEAMALFQKALELNPEYWETHTNLGMGFMNKGMLEQATVHFRAAVALDLTEPVGFFNLSRALVEQGIFEEAAAALKKSVELNPRSVDARVMLGHALAARGEFESALAAFRIAMEIAPNDPRPVNGLAWLLATCPKDGIRNGSRAVRLAEALCKATGYKDSLFTSTLAAAYAEVGRMPEAVAMATSTLNSVSPRNKPLAEKIRRHLECYKQGKPYRDGPADAEGN